MLSSSSPGCRPTDRGLFKTGMFLRPHKISSLQVIIHSRTVRDRAKFSVVKSQVQPDGFCEIIVKKLDPSVSTSSIMELLRHCYDVLNDNSPNPNRKGPDLNGTIDLSDSDDSICVLSSPHYSGRKISFKRTLSPCIESTPLSPVPLSKKLNSMAMPSLGDVENSRKVSPLTNNPIDNNNSKSTSQENSNVVQVTNNVDMSPSPLSESDSANLSVVILDVVEDNRPSAPTWTSSFSSKFPLANISKNLGKNLAKNGDIDKKIGTTGCVPIINDTVLVEQPEKMAQKSDSKSNLEPFPKRRFSDVLKGESSLVTLANVPVETFDKSANRTEVHEKVAGGHGSYPSQKDKCEESGDLGTLKDKSNQSGDSDNQPNFVRLKEDTGVKGPNLCIGAVKQMATMSSSSTSSVKVPPSSAKPITGINGGGGEDLNIDDDEIIIEKELKSDKTPSHALIIDDSDDEITVCEVINTTSASNILEVQPKISPSKRIKKKQKKQKNPHRIPAGSNFVASTSNAPAPDFIPLRPAFRRIDPKTSNCPQSADKKEKFQIIQKKRLRKERALQSKRENSSRSQVPKSNQQNMEKREFGGNILNPNSGQPKTGLRPIVIDGSNVAVGHGRGAFSVPGLKICIKYFTDRGHKVITFVPKYRRFHVSPDDRKALDELETAGILSFTPSRTMESGRKVASYDDRYVVQIAAELGGVVVSTDNYRDLLAENESWRETIEQRLLMFTWVGDILLFPNDPLGRTGPHLQDFLRFPNPSSQ